MAVGLVLLLLPLLPGIGTTIYGSRIWIRLGPLSFQPGEIAKIALIIFFAGYLVQTRDVLSLAGSKVLGLHLPARPRPRPDPRRLAASASPSSSSRRTSAPRCCSSASSSRCSTSPPSGSVVDRHRPGCSSAAAPTSPTGSSTTSRQRVELWLDPFSPRPRSSSPTSWPRASWGWPRAGCSAPGSGRAGRGSSPSPTSDFIVASFGEELGLIGVFALLVLYALLVERGLRTALGVRDGFGKLLAVGLSFSVGAPVLRRRRRRHPGHPAHRPDDAVPVARRLVAARQLDAHGDPAADLRPGPAAGARRRGRPPDGRRSAGRQRHRGGERCRERPLRRLSHRRRAALRGAAHLDHADPVRLRAVDSTPGRTTGARCSTTTPASAARSSSAASRSRSPCRRRTTSIKYLRTYPEPRPLHATSPATTPSPTGAGGGLEGAADDLLSGSSDKLFYRGSPTCSPGKPPAGATRRATINPKAQDAADKALGNQRGAVVALDPKTGAILAMVSHPQYDPNRLSQPRPRRRSSRPGSELNADPTSRWSTARSPATSTRRGRSSRSSRPPRRWRPGKFDRGLRDPRPGGPRPAPDDRRTCPTTTGSPAARTTRPR